MKKLIQIIILIFSFCIRMEAQIDSLQSLSFALKGKYERPVKKEIISEANLISEVIPDFPINWISSYTSVEMQAISKGKIIKAISLNDTLSGEQKKLLKMSEIGTDLVFTIKYRYNSPVTRTIENNVMRTTLTVVPTKEAEYIGGYQAMKKYLKEKGLSKISNETVKTFNQLIIKLIIDNDGKIIETEVTKSSGNLKTDALLLEVIKQMPQWKPAETLNGLKVSQEFEFKVNGINRNGC